MTLARPYYEALQKEIEMRPPEFSDTLYFGGGTPSTTPVKVVQDLINRMPLTKDAEISLEANPDDVNASNLDSWLKAGITRLSLGVQSLEASALRTMLRRHSAKDSIQAIETAKQAGFSNINIDLILGSPGQTAEGFMFGLTQLLDFRPQHVSLYLLEVHEGTLLERNILNGKMGPMKENVQVDCYLQAVAVLKGHGYKHYEVSNFALAGFESRHNLKYWTSASYYAYGAGACSFYDRKRIENLRAIPDYIEALAGGRLPIKSEVTEDAETEARNAVIFGLRKIEGIEVAGFQNRYGIHPLSLFENNGSLFLEEGFLEEKDGRLRITPEGILVSNEILTSAF
jgi:oxygen-independent coproporphyrinogen-3 oxidase